MTCFSQGDVLPRGSGWGLKCARAIGVYPCPHGSQKDIHGANPVWTKTQSQSQLRPALASKLWPPHWLCTSRTDTAHDHVPVDDSGKGFHDTLNLQRRKIWGLYPSLPRWALVRGHGTECWAPSGDHRQQRQRQKANTLRSRSRTLSLLT